MEKIGKYQIVGELGTGGFGTVYKATDPGIGRIVAIKVLKTQDDAGMVKRFQAEARTAASLRHPNIVTVFDFGEEKGMQFLVMEYLDGKTLRDLIVDKEPLSPVEKLSIMSDAALGLTAAHESGILHRDVKPANIMRLSDGSVKIMDFGISRPMGDVDTRLTQAGLLMGTPQYMAPEQFTGEADADILGDIWAYGVVLYEFLTGVNPFHAANAGQIIYRLTTEEPLPLSDYLADVPERLQGVVTRLLSKNREGRYQSVEDARFDLEPVLQEMQQAQVQSLIAAAEELIRDRRFDEAQGVVRRVLDLDPGNTWARRWRDELRQMVRDQSLQLRIKQLTDKAEAEVASGEETVALEYLKEALKINPANAAVRKRVEEVQASRARAERAASLLISAREEMNRKAYTRALEHASQAAETDPKSYEARQLVSEIQHAMEQRDLEVLRKNALSSATRLVLIQAFDEAIGVLKQFSAQAPGDPVIEERLEEVKRQYAAHLEQQRIERAIAESKELLRRGNYKQAILVLKPCAQSSPGNTEIAKLLAYAAEQEEAEARSAQVREILAQAEACVKSADIDKALDLAIQALEISPENEPAQQLRDRMLEARRRREEDLEIARLAAKCRAGLGSGALESADALAADLVGRFPGHPLVQQVRKEVDAKFRERKEAQEREIREQLQRVEQLLSGGKVPEAADILRSLTAKYPTQKTTFDSWVKRAAVVERELRDREMRQDTARAEELLAEGRSDEATVILQSLTARFPAQKQAFAPLFDRAAAIEREKRERREIEAEAEQFREISAAGRLEEALAAIEAGLVKRPDEPDFVEERDRVRRAIAAAKDKRERQEVEAELAQIRTLSGAGRWEDALAAIEKGLARRPDQPEFIEERDVVRRGLAASREQRERQAIEAEVARFRQLSGAGEWEKTLAAIEGALARRPNQPEFLEERDTVRRGMAAARDRQERQAMEAELLQIRQLNSTGRWDEALAQIETALGKRPNHPQLVEERAVARRGLAAARDKHERDQVEAELTQFRRIGDAGRWEEALAEIELGLGRRPGQPQFLEERDRVRRRLAAAQAVREIESRLSRSEFNPAIAMAESAQRQYPEETRIGVLLAAAREQRTLAEDLRRAEGLLLQKEIDKANTLIGDLLRRYPADATVQRLKQSLDRLLQRRQNFAAADQFRKRFEFKKALTLAAQLVKEDGDDAAARDLLDSLEREQAEYERSQRIAAGRAEALKLLRNRKLDAAQQYLERLAKEFPDNADLQDDLRRVEQARQQHETKDAYARGRAEAEALLKQRRLEDAIAKLEALLKTFPDDLFLQQDLKAAQEAKALRDRAATVETEIRALEALFNRGDAQGVRDRASRFLEQYEEPRARELLNWANKTLADVRGMRRKMDGDRRRWIWIAGIAALLVAAIVIYVSTNRPAPQQVSAEVRLRPAELTFTYERGGPLPKPANIDVMGKPAGAVWTVTASDAWFTVSPPQITGDGSFRVEANPAGKGALEYSGFATVRAKDGSGAPASVRIRLVVTEPPPQVTQVEPTQKPPEKTSEKKAVDSKKQPKTVAEVKNTPASGPTNPPANTQPATTTQPVVQQPPPVPQDPPVNCHAADYPGIAAGTVNWTGTLGAGESVTITRRNTVAAGPQGKVGGSHLPGCDVNVKVVRGNVQISESPQEANRFGQVIVKNTGAAPVSSFAIQWTVK
jgi:serine/threonine-protein kinase